MPPATRSATSPSLTQEKREAEELAAQWYEYAAAGRGAGAAADHAAMPLSAQEEQWVEQSLSEPAGVRAHRRLQREDAALQRGHQPGRGGEPGPGRARSGTQVQMELQRYAQAAAGEPQPQPVRWSGPRAAASTGSASTCSGRAPDVARRSASWASTTPTCTRSWRATTASATWRCRRSTTWSAHHFTPRQAQRRRNRPGERDAPRGAVVQTGGLTPPAPPRPTPAAGGDGGGVAARGTSGRTTSSLRSCHASPLSCGQLRTPGNRDLDPGNEATRAAQATSARPRRSNPLKESSHGRRCWSGRF